MSFLQISLTLLVVAAMSAGQVLFKLAAMEISKAGRQPFSTESFWSRWPFAESPRFFGWPSYASRRSVWPIRCRRWPLFLLPSWLITGSGNPSSSIPSSAPPSSSPASGSR